MLVPGGYLSCARWGLGLIHKAQIEGDGAQAFPKGLITGIGMGFVVGEQHQQMRGFKGEVLAVEVPRRDAAPAGQKLDLGNVETCPLVGFAGPGDAFALQ
jgi:hypothetical protein